MLSIFDIRAMLASAAALSILLTIIIGIIIKLKYEESGPNDKKRTSCLNLKLKAGINIL